MNHLRSLLVCLILVGSTRGDELLRYVPADVTFCLVVRDLKTHAATLGDSPFADQFRRSPLGKTLLASPELKQALEIDKFVEKMVGMNLDRIRDDVLGQSIVFAFRQGPGEKKEQEQGLVMLRARDEKTLADLMERLNKYLKEVGTLKTTEIEFEGIKYQKRVEGDETNYVCLRGPVLIFSGQEALLREALTLAKKTPASQEPAVARSLRLLDADKTFASMWINPRSFDADLTARLKKATGADRAFLETFVPCWKSLDGMAVTLSLGRDLEIGLALRGRPEAMPREVRRFLDEASAVADLWGRFPDDALIATAARTPAAELLALLGTFQTKESFDAFQEQLKISIGALLGGKDIVKDVLPAVGPDWGVSMTAPVKGDKAWFPSTLFALRVESNGEDVGIDRSLLDMVQLQGRLLMLAFNKSRKDPLLWKTAKHEKLEIAYLASTGGRAMGLQPAVGLCHGYLVIASTPETLKRFAVASKATKSSVEVPLLRMSFAGVRDYLKEYRLPLTKALAEAHQQTPAQIGGQLDELLNALSMLDRLELTQRTAAGRATFTLRLRPSQSLKK